MAVSVGQVYAQPNSGVTFKCVPPNRCTSSQGGPVIGTNPRIVSPATSRASVPPPQLNLQLLAGTVGRSVNMQLIADRNGRVDLRVPELVLLKSSRYGLSASRRNKLINYRCLQTGVQNSVATYSCRIVR
ncbi:hypothetical protein [Deinococcus sp.]|uniref:hypothetical protein n=1 Tax=Deinococcus sp. TaxID=47478 RepID=UPI003B5C0D25